MESVKEKVAYLHGLAQGLDVNEQTKEGKLMLNMLKVLDVVAEEFDEVYEAQEELAEYVESIDEDLNSLEENFYDDAKDTVEVECPECHEIVTFAEDVLDDDEPVEVTCPSCGSVVYCHDDEEHFCREDHDE